MADLQRSRRLPFFRFTGSSFCFERILYPLQRLFPVRRMTPGTPFLPRLLILATGLLLALVLLQPPAPVQAQQQATVSGYVTDAASGETLLGANVILMGTDIGTTTNNSGYYVIRSIEPGEYTLRFSYLGYDTLEEEIELEPGEERRLDVELREADLTLEELVVESEREREVQLDIGREDVSVELIRNVPSVLQADVFRTVQLLPGISAASDFSSGLYIRGGGPGQTLIQLDRTTVYNPTHAFGFFSTFTPDAIKDVQIYKGGYPAEYGGRLGSVIDLRNKDGNRNETRGSASLGLLSSRGLIEGPHRYGSYMVAARRSTIEPVLYALRQNVDTVPDDFYFYDVNAKLNLDLGPDDRVGLSTYLGADDLVFPVGEDLNLQLVYGNRTFSADWTHIFTSSLFSRFTVTGSRYFNRPRFELGGTPIERENTVTDYSVKGDLEWIPDNDFQMSFGFWTGELELTIDDRFDDADTFSSRIRNRYASAYVQNTWRPARRWKIDAGLRVSYFDGGDYVRLDPRFSVDYFLQQNMRLQASAGRYHQFLTLITSEAFSGFDTWLTTSEGVEPAWGDQFALGYKYEPLEGYSVEVEGYYRTMRDLFELDPFIQDPAGLDYADRFRIGDGYAFGAEFMLERQVGRLNGFLAYTFGHTRRRFPQINQGEYYPPRHDRLNELNAVLRYRLSDSWRASGVFSYATGQAYTRPLGQANLTNDPFDAATVNTLMVGRVNASRLPPYHRLDLGVTRTGTFFGYGETELQLQAINVYSRRNIWFYQYDFDQQPVERQEVPMLPILPNITYNISF